ncbi:PQQ-binding-like beta-propeller repeat protein [Rurimicrobium arvi]|uniref:Pyrrolo-quinoline quinone repeat domain-containing protein n=1 Tax=Rurimicrobium arvi TaxID=2049916 RepID=A0ABP8MRF1_9BACT
MNYNWTKALLSSVVAATLFTSCKPTPDTDTPFPPTASTAVFIGSQNQFIYSLNPMTGAKKWEVNVGAPVYSSPVLYNNILFVGTPSSTLYKIDPITGTKKSSKVAIAYGMTTTPIGQENLLIYTTGNRIAAIDITPDTTEWFVDFPGTLNSSPIVSDSMVIFGCDNGTVYARNFRNGNAIWSSANFSTQFNCSPTVDTGNVYIGGENGVMYCLDRRTGSLKWQFASGAGKPIKSSPVVFGGSVIFGNDDYKLFCLENVFGTPRWTVKTDDRIRSSPYLYGDRVYVGSYDKKLYVIDVLNGAIRWIKETDGLIASSPVCYQNYVYFGSYDKYLYALDTAKGSLLWKYAVNGLIDCSPSIDPNDGKGMGINSSVSGASVY